VGIVGPRGVGKTVLLKQLASESSQSFYLSLDASESPEAGDLFEISKKLVERYDTKLLLVDEIHFDRQFHQKLKAIYDFLDLRIIFTSSVALALFESAYDLSRRVQLKTLYPFSFREYVYFKTEKELPGLSLHRIASESEFGEYLRYGDLFEDYIKGGLMPFSLEEPDVLPVLANIIRTVLQRDIPEIARLRTDEVASLGKVLNFVGRSAVDGVNYSSVSRNVGITKYKAEQYIRLLEKYPSSRENFSAESRVSCGYECPERA
jgi:predicted AAA+ superfamily ATPase